LLSGTATSNNKATQRSRIPWVRLQNIPRV
jgi:hypothetical protein